MRQLENAKVEINLVGYKKFIFKDEIQIYIVMRNHKIFNRFNKSIIKRFQYEAFSTIRAKTLLRSGSNVPMRST